MAKILSSPWSIIRGSIGGTTYFSGPHNAILARQRTSPVNPRTLYQQIIRGAMAAAQSIWQAGSAAERTAWNTYAQTVVYSGPLGNYTPSGIQMFHAALVLGKYMSQRFAAIITLNITAPVVSGLMLQSGIVVDVPSVAGTGFNMKIDNSDTEGAIALIRISPAYKQSRNFYKGPYDPAKEQILTVAAGTTTPVDILGLVEGMAYFVSSRLIGQGELHRISGIVTTKAIAAVTV